MGNVHVQLFHLEVHWFHPGVSFLVKEGAFKPSCPPLLLTAHHSLLTAMCSSFCLLGFLFVVLTIADLLYFLLNTEIHSKFYMQQFTQNIFPGGTSELPGCFLGVSAGSHRSPSPFLVHNTINFGFENKRICLFFLYSNIFSFFIQSTLGKDDILYPGK